MNNDIKNITTLNSMCHLSEGLEERVTGIMTNTMTDRQFMEMMYQEMHTRFDKVEGDVTRMQGDITEMKSDISSIKAKQLQHDERFDALQNQLLVHDRRITALEENVG